MNSSSTQSLPGTSERFAFGKNWQRFLQVLNNDRIALAEESVRQLLQVQDLAGQRFLDIGSGSGLFSLAARRLGADVVSFDYDPDSVACTLELRRRFFPNQDGWDVQQGSVLDDEFLKRLGQFDVVYSWGVLHHTGAMWDAFDKAAGLVADNGQLAISIYNDQGGWSRRWLKIKRCYNALPALLQPPFAAAVIGCCEFKYLMLETIRLRPWAYFRNIRDYSKQSLRGMSYWHDLVDWIGGYPFEVARPEDVFDFFRDRGFVLQKLTTMAGGHGCNEFVFQHR